MSEDHVPTPAEIERYRQNLIVTLNELTADVKRLRDLYEGLSQSATALNVSISRVEAVLAYSMRELDTHVKGFLETGRSLIRLAKLIVIAFTLAVVASLGQTISIDMSHEGIKIRRNLEALPTPTAGVAETPQG